MIGVTLGLGITELNGIEPGRNSSIWFALIVAGISVHRDLLGVTSIVRALGLKPAETCF